MDEILALAAEVMSLSRGMEMVAAWLRIARQLAQIRQDAALSQLVDLALNVIVLPDFMTKVQALLLAPPTSNQES